MNLKNAMLEHSDFGGTLLDRVIFTGADLSEADFQGTASCRGTVFEGASLTLSQFHKVLTSPTPHQLLTNSSPSVSPTCGSHLVRSDGTCVSDQ